VIPRWEWRAFGEGFGAAEERLSAAAAERVEESLDVYVLSPTSDASVKVRAGKLDVKRLEAVDDAGLEQWRPVMKAAFPLATDQAGEVLETLGVAGGGGVATLDELVAASPGLQAVPVRKRRTRYTFAGCMAEVSELRTDASATRTLAVESEDAGLVSAALRELGLAGRGNVCMARGLKALLGIGSRRYAVIDVGTNSVKFHIGERLADGSWHRVADRAEVTRLGEGLDRDGRLGAAPIERTCRGDRGDGRRGAPERRRGDRRRGHRRHANGAEFDRARRRRPPALRRRGRGDRRRGGGPARLPRRDRRTRGLRRLARRVRHRRRQLAVHVRQRRQVDERFSLNVGAARFTERYGLDGAVSTDTLAEALAAIAGDLAPAGGRPPPDAIVGMGGAVTNLAAVGARAGDLRPGRRAGHRARPCRDRPADRALPHARRGRPARDHRPAAQPSGGDPGGGVHRPDRGLAARPRLLHRQRPRTAPRPDRRTLRAAARQRRRNELTISVTPWSSAHTPANTSST
jgi:exopolyphosphatase/guanosine-5'-triphosphate,3'-diphosphate pyrophosphatase